jgi:SM-20-related protein
MPNANFFRNLGLFVQENFLAADLCDQLRDQMSKGKFEPGIILGEHEEAFVEESVRKVASVDVDRSLDENVRRQLIALMPKLEDHFKVSLEKCQGPDFLKYGVGSFYLPHVDGNPSGPSRVAKRRVSVVVFLNAQLKDPSDNTYCGGSLTFYGLMDGPEWAKLAFPLEAEKGLLVAFRSDVLHEVQPVTHGERFSAVSWYTSAE